MPTFLALPNELLFSIIGNLDRVSDLYSLTRTNRELQLLVTPLLLKIARNPSPEGTLTAYQWAASSGCGNLIRFLLDKGVDMNLPSYGNYHRWDPVLHRAVNFQNLSILRLLLERGADPDIRDDFGSTALHEAARRGVYGAVKILLDAGADASIRDPYGRMPCHYAANWSDEVEAKCLLQAGRFARRRES